MKQAVNLIVQFYIVEGTVLAEATKVAHHVSISYLERREDARVMPH